MNKDLTEKLAYVGRIDGKIVALCTPVPNVVADTLPEWIVGKYKISLEDRETAKAEWIAQG